MKDLIKKQILDNKVNPHDFEINEEELTYLNNIQDDLFDKLNDFDLTFITDSDTIMTHLIIARRINSEITINEFIQLYSEITQKI